MLGKELRIVSGGLRLAVVTFAGWLGVEDDHVHAVQAWFDGDSRLSSFDRDNPLTRSGGKKQVLASLPPKRTAFVGDGMTDAEARDAVACFICYTGVARRPEVAALAHAVVEGSNFANLLPALCSPDELAKLTRDPRHGRLIHPRMS
jgi:phosphoserine phosphatase